MMVKPSISLSFDGHCEAAFKFYERCFGATITMLLTWGDSPMAKDAPPEWGGKIFHASLTVGDLKFAGGDALPQQYQSPRGFAVVRTLSDAVEAERLFHALAEHGTVIVPLRETFWAIRFGEVTDRFGIPWAINCGDAQ